MEENKYFKEALHNFTYDVACGDAIRQLYDLGYDNEHIRDRLDYPVSMEKIEATVRAYKAKLAEEAATELSYEYVREEDEYGHASFRRVPKKR